MRPPVPREAPAPAPWQPPLSLWGHVWRLLLMLLISSLVWLPVVEWDTPRPVLMRLIDVGLGLLGLVLVHLRRRQPLLVAVLTSVLTGFSGSAAGPATLAAVSLATHRRYGQIALVGVLGVAMAQFWSVTAAPAGDDPAWVTLTANLTFVAATLVFGMYVGSRRELLWTLRERAERAEAEQSLRIDQARTNERQRIAREMHDVLGHRISLVGMHAGALAYREDLDRQQVAESARVIGDNARLAMSELRSVLGVLRADAEAASDRPSPTLDGLPALVEEAVATGMRVDLHEDVVRAEDLPDATGRTVYRIVQEGLTNVRKHATDARTTVQVAGSPDLGLVVRVENPLPPGVRRSTAGAGFGIVGLSERAELAGGSLRSRVEDGRFVLEVTLPWATPTT